MARFDFIVILSDKANQIFINFESSYNLTKSYFLSSIAVITCPTLPTPPHGTKLGCHWNVMYDGTVCHFSCNDGFIGSGSQERRCQRNGTWTGQDFGCQGKFPTHS